MDFQLLLILAILWLVIVLPISRLYKSAKESSTSGSGAAKPARKQSNAAESVPAEAPAAPPARETTIRPSISVTEHDDSIYLGSLNAITGEGYDPCHNEQLAPLTAAETEIASVSEEAPGLRLVWSGSEIVRGFVMSEILTRKRT